MRTKRLCEDDKILIAIIKQHGSLVDYEADCAKIGFWKDNPLVRLAWERAKKAHTMGMELKKEGEK